MVTMPMRDARQECGRWLSAAAAAVVTVLLAAGVATGKNGAPAGAAAPETLVISEVMYHPPSSLAFPAGQWVEVYNAGAAPALLEGVEIVVVSGDDDTASKSHVISGLDSPFVNPGEYLVLGTSKALAVNGGIQVAYAFGPEMSLPKSGGALSLALDGQVLDQVVFGPGFGKAATPGRSLSLEPEGLSPELNDEPGYWCESKAPVADATVETYGSPGAAGAACDSDLDGPTEDEGDCDDHNPSVLPGVQEKCNGVDDDCDGDTDEEPLSDIPMLPGVGVCALSAPECEEGGTWKWTEPDDYEPDGEVSCDFKDNDCDGDVDEGLRNACDTCGMLGDPCDGQDNDCDGDVDEDPPESGVFEACGLSPAGVCLDLEMICAASKGWQCPAPAAEYQQVEASCDGLDNDCDSMTDEDFPVGAPCIAGTGSCAGSGTYVCAEDGSGVECLSVGGEAGKELCGDNVDNDCDGETDEGFPIGDLCDVGVGACRVTGKLQCSAADGLDVECSAVPLHPTEELCGTLEDEDCDGKVDEADCAGAQAPAPGCRASLPGSTSITLSLLAGSWLLLTWIRRRRTDPL